MFQKCGAESVGAIIERPENDRRETAKFAKTDNVGVRTSIEGWAVLSM